MEVGESIQAIGLSGVWEGNAHARGEWGPRRHRSALVPGCQVQGGRCAHALPVQDDAVWADAVQGAPGGVDVCKEVLPRRSSRANAIARVVIGGDPTVDACAQASVEAGLLAQGPLCCHVRKGLCTWLLAHAAHIHAVRVVARSSVTDRRSWYAPGPRAGLVR